MAAPFRWLCSERRERTQGWAVACSRAKIRLTGAGTPLVSPIREKTPVYCSINAWPALGIYHSAREWYFCMR